MLATLLTIFLTTCTIHTFPTEQQLHRAGSASESMLTRAFSYFESFDNGADTENRAEALNTSAIIGSKISTIENTAGPIPTQKQITFLTSVNYAAGFGPRPIPPRRCRCGIRNPAGFPRIYNGEQAKVNEFPWRVSINPSSHPSLSFCSGALIHRSWVLTSASCVHQRSLDSFLVDLGDHNLHDEREAANVLVSVTKKIVHQDYAPQPSNPAIQYPNNVFEENDIALLRLAEPIEEDNIMPVCLPRRISSNSLNGATVVTSGWGVVGPEGTSRVLNRIGLTYVSGEEFRRDIGPRYFTQVKAPQSDSLVFTFDVNKGIYPVDHGTTMEYLNVTNGLYYAVGVADGVHVSEVGHGIQHMLGAWTDVTRYLRWIDDQTDRADFCKT